MHDAVRSFIQKHASKEPCVVLECGSRDVNGTVRDLFPQADWTGVDTIDGPLVDVVEDFADYTHPELVDFVISTEVLEHCERWREIIEAAGRNLSPGGTFLCTAATHGRGPHSAIDEQPIREWEYYRNIDPQELGDELARHFAGWKVRVVGLDVQAWAVK